MTVQGTTRRIACLLGAAALAGCGGSDSEYANEPKPAAPINVTAAITERELSVAPARFGAGPIVLLVANQTDEAQSVTFETDEIGGPGPGVTQTTSPINPGGTAALKLDVREGAYRLSASNRLRAAIRVGAPRQSAQDELLQP